MTTSFSAKTLEGAWLKAVRAVTTQGTVVDDTDKFKEIRNLHISYSNAFETTVLEYSTIFGTEYLAYMARVYSPVGDPASGRNYYNLIYNQDGVNQVEKITDRLRSEPLSRSATIVLASLSAPKQPCVSEINFSIRNDLLHMNVIFKSSDLAKKFIPDLVEISRIHKEISDQLHIARGEVSAHILSAQIYEKDLGTILDAISKRRLKKYFDTDKIVENWNDEAKNWDTNIKNPRHYVNIEDGYERFLSFLRTEIKTGTSDTLALDSGCGTGLIAEELVTKGYTVVGIDIAPKMLEFAHKSAGRVSYVRANGLDIPFPDEYFDVICSRGVLISHVGKAYIDALLAEQTRVLKKGGVFLFDFITHFESHEKSNQRSKAAASYDIISKKIKLLGFEILGRAGTDSNRVNAIYCRKM